MLRARLTWTMMAALMMGIALEAGTNTALAGPISPGFDLFSTPMGGAFLPLPGGGMIPLMGKGIQGTNTDTIVERKTGLPAGGTGPIPAEIVALSLQSVAPVQMGSSFFDVFVTINKGLFSQHDLPQPDMLSPSLGMVTIKTHDDTMGGGLFDSFFDVFVDVTFKDTMTGAMTSMPTTTPDRITSTDIMWAHTPIMSLGAFPTGGFSTPRGVMHTGPHPQTVPATQPFPDPVPEPSSIILLGLGLAGLVGFGSKRLVKKA